MEHRVYLEKQSLLPWTCPSLVPAQDLLMSELPGNLETIWSELLQTQRKTEFPPRARELEPEHG